MLKIKKKILKSIKRIDFTKSLNSFISSFVGIAVLGYISTHSLETIQSIFLIGSFGATAVLIFGIPNSEYSRPRNVIGGHFISAIIGVTTVQYIFPELWLAAAFSVSFSIFIMTITRTLHPPGGATSLIACIGAEKVTSLGYTYAFSPVLLGSVILVIVALLMNKEYYEVTFKRTRFQFGLSYKSLIYILRKNN